MAVIPTIIYSCMLGMIVFALLELCNKPRQKQSKFLFGLFLLLIIHIAGELFIYSGAYQYAPGLAGAQFPLQVLLGPALYFYACAAMSSENRLNNRAYLLALSGPVLVVLAMLPFIFGISPEEKLALADPATRDPELWKIALFTCFFATLVFILFTCIYLTASLKLHSKHRLQLMDRFSAIEQRSLDWFRPILLLWGAAWLMYAIEYTLGLFRWRWFGTGIVLPAIEALILMVFIQRALNQPTLKDTEKAKPDVSEPRVATLSKEKMTSVTEKLRQAMMQHHLFKEDDLSLKRLSEAVSETENHISETLSQHLHTNFYQFVNGYRVQAAKELLAISDKPIINIAFDAGFKSKSTFNASFKKDVGMTPSAFRNSAGEVKSQENVTN